MSDDGSTSVDLQSVHSVHQSTDISSECGQNEIVLCIFWKSGKLGAATFIMETSEVNILNDIVDVRPDFNALKSVFLQLQPTVVICCSSAPEVFLNVVRELSGDKSNDGEDDPNQTSRLYLYPSKIFKYEICRKRVLMMKILSEPANISDDDHIYYINSIINFTCTSMTCALGALLFAIDKTLSGVSLQVPSKNILAVNTLSLDNLVWIDQTTYNALEIFAPATHPSAYKWVASDIKQGFSVYGLINKCYSRLGSKYMRVLLSNPIKDINVLKKRHEVIEFCLKPTNEAMVKNLTDCIKNISNITSILTRIIGTQATAAQWKTLYKTVHNAITIGEICYTYRQHTFIFKQIAECMDDKLYTINSSISNLMDIENSEKQGRFVVKEGAVPELDQLKERRHVLPVIMEAVAQQELQNLPDYIQCCSIIYIPEIGYLLAIPLWSGNLSDDHLNIHGLNFKFKINDVAHYKSARCEEMDEILGDCQLIVLKYETEIMCQLVNYIQENITPLLNIINKITLLDCLISLSIVARDYELVKPELVNNGTMFIKNGRHFLQQLCVDTFVPNDYSSSLLEKDGLIKILTGPNASGKSVYLKQTAMIAYLAHVGSFVPAEKAVITVLDHIHSRIQSIESISTQLSAFMIDLRQMYQCIYNSTNNSLLVIDEFGKGTSDVDGFSLLAASIKHFIERQHHCPHIIISTHFHSLPSLLPSSPIVKFQTLEHVLDGEDIAYLYKLKEGVTTSSYAYEAARNVGLSSHVTSRASQILRAIQSDEDVDAPSDRVLTLLHERRKQFAQRFLKMEITTIQDIKDIYKMLNDVRL